MKKLSSIVLIVAILTASAQASTQNPKHLSVNSLRKENQRLYCVDARNHFDLRATITEAPYSHATLRKIDIPAETPVLVRTMSTMTYPRRSVEIIQIMKTDDKSHPLSLNLVKSYDCTHRASGKIYPLRALIMDTTTPANPELLNLFDNSDICCAKY